MECDERATGSSCMPTPSGHPSIYFLLSPTCMVMWGVLFAGYKSTSVYKALRSKLRRRFALLSSIVCNLACIISSTGSVMFASICSAFSDISVALLRRSP